MVDGSDLYIDDCLSGPGSSAEHQLRCSHLHADMGPRATGKEAVATVVVDKMRRRMRQNGYHAHITLQVCPLPVQLPEAIV